MNQLTAEPQACLGLVLSYLWAEQGSRVGDCGGPGSSVSLLVCGTVY